MTVIAVVNESEDVTDAQVRLIAKACHLQIQKHVAPLYAFEPWPVRFYTKEKYAPKDSCVILILEDAGKADALGFHDETPKGRRYGRVFTRFLLDDDGTLHDGAYSVSVILSHECIEAFIDPDINIWAEGESGEMWAYEACDPVQEDAYNMRVDGETIAVSNFVLPAWFDKENPKGTRFDYMRKLKKPFTFTKGGYALFWNGQGPERVITDHKRKTAHAKKKQKTKNNVLARSYQRTGGRLKFK